MKYTRVFTLVAVFAAICFAAHAESGRADLRGTAEGSPLSGSVAFRDTPGGLSVRAAVENATPGPHGFHIHRFGSCGDAGKAAGDHYNPAGAPHGNLLKDGFERAHAGDLGNFEVGADGKGVLEVLVPGICLAGCERSVAGRSVVFHENRDDFGQPSGNAGPRSGCGGIFLTGENS